MDDSAVKASDGARKRQTRLHSLALVTLFMLVLLFPVARCAHNNGNARWAETQHYIMVLDYLEEQDAGSELTGRVGLEAISFGDDLRRKLRMNLWWDILMLSIVVLLLVEHISAVRRLRVSGSGRAPGGE